MKSATAKRHTAMAAPPVSEPSRVMNILIVGVGGQGVVLASQILSEVALKAGFEVKKSEVHGMSQRGGVVSSHVRFGAHVASPLIPNGGADVILAFERAEALRWAHELKAGGSLIANTQMVVPPIAVDTQYAYPDDALEMLRRRVEDLRIVDAAQIAAALGNPRLANTVLLGALSARLAIAAELWREVIPRRVPKGTAEINLKAFEAGRDQ